MNLLPTPQRVKRVYGRYRRRVFNSVPVAQLKMHLARKNWASTGARPQGQAARIAEELIENGIAVTSVAELGLGDALWDELRETCLALATSREALALGADPRGDKDFFYRLLGWKTLNVYQADIFNRVSLHPTVLAIANQYLRSYCWLMRYNVWLNLPSGAAPATSQLWHRDGDSVDRYEVNSIVKMFIAVSELTVDNGAFSYIPGTQVGGWRADLKPPFILENGTRRSPDEQMRSVVPESEWLTPTGGPGTVILTDTSGFHKGGYLRQGRRILYKTLYGTWLSPTGAMVRIHKLDGLEDAGRPEVRWATSWK